MTARIRFEQGSAGVGATEFHRRVAGRLPLVGILPRKSTASHPQIGLGRKSDGCAESDGTRKVKKLGSCCSWSPLRETQSGFLNDILQSINFRREGATPVQSEGVKTPVIFLQRVRFWSVCDQASVHQLLQVVIQRARAHPVVTI